jgi:thiamine-phosphate pyrophosphorylase
MADRPALARRLRRLTKDRGLRLLVAADARLACAIGADGFHLPEAAACSGNRTWRRWRRPGWLVTAAAHSPRAMFASAALAVDAVLLSPVFSTASHPEATPLGALRFARMVRASPLPVYALGGVTAPRMGLIGLSGAVGVAGISGIADIATRRRRWRRRAPAFPQASAS